VLPALAGDTDAPATGTCEPTKGSLGTSVFAEQDAYNKHPQAQQVRALSASVKVRNFMGCSDQALRVQLKESCSCARRNPRA
jgi:hypothetical protein